MKRTILYVDDEPENLVVFEAVFEDQFHILSATSAREALDVLEQTPVPVVVADQRMPGMTGVELFEITRQRFPFIQRVILTAYSDPEAMMDAINKGDVFQFVKKPWDRHQLLSILIRAVETHDLALANTALTDRLVVSEWSARLGRAASRIAREMENRLSSLPALDFIEDRYSNDADVRHIIEFARRGYDHLVELVNEIKSFAQADEGGASRQRVPLLDVLHETIELLRLEDAVSYERLTLRVRNTPVVRADKRKLQQAVAVLIEEATHDIRGREDGWIQLTLDADTEEAVLTFSHNGCSPQVPAQPPGLTVPALEDEKRDGRAFGLDAVRRQIENQPGRLHCGNGNGSGTTWEVRLPLCESEDSERAGHLATAGAADEPQLPYQPE